MSFSRPHVDGAASARSINEFHSRADAPTAAPLAAPVRSISRRVSKPLISVLLSFVRRLITRQAASATRKPEVARPTIRPVLSDRQELVLRKVVEEHLAGGTPVGSKALSSELRWGSSTIRNELASLEEFGLLAHPHTSAGRVPTEAGYRYFVDRLLPAQDPAPRLSLSLVRRELDEAMRVTSETLSQVTNLLAIVTAPPIETSTIRRVEVLVLQPQVLMVVVITSTGSVTKRLFTFSRPVDPGLADWA